MSIENSDTIDAIGVERKTGAVVLTIADHLDWTDEQNHLILLQSKLSTYVNFIETGQLHEAYPDAKDRKVVISVVTKFKPGSDAIRVLLQARDSLAPIGIEFRCTEFEKLKLRAFGV